MSMEVVIKYLAFGLAASFLVLLFFWGLSQLVLGHDPIQEPTGIIDDSNMNAPSPTAMCDCYYRAGEGSLAPASQGTGCNLLTMKNIDKTKIPECLQKVMR